MNDSNGYGNDDSYGWQDYNDYNNNGYYGEQY